MGLSCLFHELAIYDEGDEPFTICEEVLVIVSESPIEPLKQRLIDKVLFGHQPSPELLAILLVYFVQGILGLARLAVSFFLKDDLAMGPALFLVACNPTPGRAALFVVGSLAATAVLVGFLVIAGSLTFFFGGRGEQADLAFQAVLILSSYPLDIFGGATRVVLFTAIPAAFITGLPARLVRSFDPTLLAVVTGAGVLFLAAAVAVFELGLRRYRSGALWTRA